MARNNGSLFSQKFVLIVSNESFLVFLVPSLVVAQMLMTGASFHSVTMANELILGSGLFHVVLRLPRRGVRAEFR